MVEISLTGRNQKIQLLVPALILTTFGLVMIYSTGGSKYLVRQVLFLPVAACGFLLGYFLPRRLIYGLSYLAYAAGVALLVAVLFLGHGPARRWFDLGPVNFQPSELAKLGCVVALAHFMSDHRRVSLRLRDLWLPTLLCLLPMGLVLIEPDLGTSIVFLVILAATLYWSGLDNLQLFLFFSPLLAAVASLTLVSWSLLLGVLVIFLFWSGQNRAAVLRSQGLGILRSGDAVAGAARQADSRRRSVYVAIAICLLIGLLTPALVNRLHDYQKARITSFLMPWLDPKGIGWNGIQSQIAVGSGRIFGKGLFAGTQKGLEFLPNRHTDFIFSCIAEETGLVGGLVVIGLFALLVFRMLRVATEAKDPFSSVLAAGLTANFAYSVIVNIAMVLGLAPITGIALPFLTYGGSPLVLNSISLGLILNVSHRPA
ncbi:MAG: FtsW/RodA/SpoVE family cell cycle protein [candidate division WOR-3 bacterium]